MRITFPNESSEYRSARDRLLQLEIALRRQMEAVAIELRALPAGGQIPENYLFDSIGEGGEPATARMSQLFGSGDTTAELQLEQGPCPSCTALIDMWEGTMPHFYGLGGNLAVVAKAPIERVAAFARERGWKHIRLLSAANNNFRRDYGGDGPDGQPVPLLTVFKRWPDGAIRLHWASELIHAASDPGQDPRHLGTVEPLWTLFDLTPSGRPAADEQMQYPCGDHGRRAQ